MPSGGKRKGAGRKPKDTTRIEVSFATPLVEKYGRKGLRKLIHEFIKTL